MRKSNFRLLVALAAGCLVWFQAGEALARLPDPPRGQVEERSSLIVIGEVLSAKLIRSKKDARYFQGSYQAELKITMVIKGAAKKGDVIRVAWDSRFWIAKTRRPPGHYIFPNLFPCYEVKAFLSGAASPYRFTSWAGLRTRRTAPGTRLPRVDGELVRCVNGKIVSLAPPRPRVVPMSKTTMAGAPHMKTGAADPTKKQPKKKKGCGCQTDGGTGALGLILLLLGYAVITRPRR